ncbi:amino acid ABC transporter permease [Siculibacillus lacustris]|uniref:Amino acid ABC transporter permease n=1 Tax=Siculibacillus lacustris TaxID=1549641 RepID=A0A4V2KUD4_9HYPH|nr:amino acid ABC transporter permease [Siculibacillus lacustris]TBW41046.1 amino acid ABC transporter permease [Siculibacillus lacustris]
MTSLLGYLGGEDGRNILSGLVNTCVLWVVGTLLGTVLGFLTAVARRYGPRPIDWLLKACVEVIRGTPFLVQAYLLYFGGPYLCLELGGASACLTLDPFEAGILGLTIYAGAYFSELFRAGFDAIPRGHIEAATTVGLDRWQTLRRIILPEMTMLVLPAMVNMSILLLKETAVLSIISVKELKFQVDIIGNRDYAFVEAFTILALVYWALVELCGRAGRYAEARLSRYRFAHS